MSVDTSPERTAPARPAATRRRLPATGLAVLVLAVLTAVGALALLMTAPPPARDTSAPAGEFSAARAEKHLAHIAQRPHPLGSADSARVRGYLADTARSLGADVSIESGPVVRPDWGNPFPAGDAHNVVAKVPGTGGGSGKALLLVAHYDSVPTGPGAADNGAAVAALLETMRALRASGGVPNDVVFLFTDGEELGALGAEKFVRDHGVDAYGAVLNWEARGSSGPVMMFETSVGNAPLIDAFAGASSRPVANSLAYEVYKRMPNGSDFTVFRDAGAYGLNSAFLHGFHDYHSVHDDIERLSPDSMQHHGETMLGLVQGLGASDLGAAGGGDAVYFDLFARVLVHYPADWALPLAAGTALALAGLLVLGARRGGLRPAGVLVAAGTAAAVVVAAALAGAGLWLAVVALAPGLEALPLSEPYERGIFAAGFLTLVAGVLLAAARILRRRTLAEVVGGALLFTAVLLVATVLTVPGASYLLQWPLLAGLPALWWASHAMGDDQESRAAGDGRRDLAAMGLNGAAPLVAAVLFAPLVDSLLIALGIPLAAVAMAVAAIGAILLLPLLGRLPRTGLAALGAAVLALALLTTGTLRADFGPDRPRPNSLIYVRDHETGTARWLSPDAETDDWTRKALGGQPDRTTATEYFPGEGDREFLSAPAPQLELPAPEVQLTGDRTQGGVRTVRFSVRSQRDAWRLQVALPQKPLRACTVAGVRMDAKTLAKDVAYTGNVVFQYTGARDAVEFSCEIPAGEQLAVDVSDFTVGLPAAARVLVGPRPAGTVPVAYGYAPDDTSVTRSTATL